MPLIWLGVPMPALLKRFALIFLPAVLMLSLAQLAILWLNEQKWIERIEVRENSRIELVKGLVTHLVTCCQKHQMKRNNAPLSCMLYSSLC